MKKPVLPVRKRTERVERVETHSRVPKEMLDMIADLNTRLLRQAQVIRDLEGRLARVESPVAEIVRFANRHAS